MSSPARITGKLFADRDRRTGQSGEPFILARIAAHDGDSDAPASVMTFGTAAARRDALGKGYTITICDRTKDSTWTGKDGSPRASLSVAAEIVPTDYAFKRKRQAVAEAGSPSPERLQAYAQPGGASELWLDGGGR